MIMLRQYCNGEPCRLRTSWIIVQDLGGTRHDDKDFL